MNTETSELGKTTLEAFRNIKNLPTIPKVVLEVNEMLRNHTGDMARLTEIVGKDQGLTTKVLAVANSPLYGLPKNVASLEFGIMLLGIGEISNIVTALSLAQIVRGNDSEDFDYLKFWTHSMLVGTASKDIAKRLGFGEIAGDAFVAGMLHDIGIQLTSRYFPTEFKKIISIVNDSDMDYYQAEQEVLGVTHEDIGHFMITKWNLPSNLSEVIGYHHRPSKLGKENIVLNIIHLADTMTKMFDIGNFAWDSGVEFDESIITTLGFANRSEIEEFIEEYFLVFQDTASTIKL
ncbi:MAG: HDOD domain-containing protein [Melioribacteraceae bacterium]|jgi:HD-like signal output (HDOD) protein|nr:HDOD domain-containing protein [Melioribacteraceae bacterium]